MLKIGIGLGKTVRMSLVREEVSEGCLAVQSGRWQNVNYIAFGEVREADGDAVFYVTGLKVGTGAVEFHGRAVMVDGQEREFGCRVWVEVAEGATPPSGGRFETTSGSDLELVFEVCAPPERPDSEVAARSGDLGFGASVQADGGFDKDSGQE